MKAFIPFYDSVPIDTWAYAAYMGFRNKGFDMVAYEEVGEIPAIKLVNGSPDKIVVASIEDMVALFKKNDIQLPLPLNVPTELEIFAGRRVWTSSLAEVRSEKIQFPFYLKPAHDLKLFAAQLIREKLEIEDIASSLQFPEKTICLLSEPLDIISEYRGFVCNGILVGLKHYAGDLSCIPDVATILQAIQQYRSAPAAYTIDFGVTNSGGSVLIECNDGWSVDSYGLDGNIYADFLLARWMDLVV